MLPRQNHPGPQEGCFCKTDVRRASADGASLEVSGAARSCAGGALQGHPEQQGLASMAVGLGRRPACLRLRVTGPSWSPWLSPALPLAGTNASLEVWGAARQEAGFRGAHFLRPVGHRAGSCP